MYSADKAVSKKDFDKSLNQQTRVRKKATSFFISRTKYNKLLSQVKSARKKSGEVHQSLSKLLKKYDVIKLRGVERLAVPNSSEKLIYIPQDELFSVISKEHIKTDHGTLPEIAKRLKARYKNVANEAIVAYLKLCQKCPRKLKPGSPKLKQPDSKEEDESKENKETVKSKGSTPEIEVNKHSSESTTEIIEELPAITPKPKSNRKYKPRSAPESASTKPLTVALRTPQTIEFIEMINLNDYEYNYIVVLRESTTKFVHLRPLKSRAPEELADVLFSIFICFGTPSVLLSSNGDFIENTIQSLYTKHPNVSTDIVVEGTEEARFFADIETLMLSWVCQNSSERWYNGLRFIQYIANLTYNKEISMTPFEAMFGRKGKLDVSNLNLPVELMHDIRPAEDPEEEVKDLDINEMVEVVMDDEE